MELVQVIRVTWLGGFSSICSMDMPYFLATRFDTHPLWDVESKSKGQDGYPRGNLSGGKNFQICDVASEGSFTMPFLTHLSF